MTQMDTAQLVALAAALGWASGLRLYLVLLAVGLTGYFGWYTLPSGLQVLSHPVVMGASGLMVFMEFFADKIPGIDSVWDFLHTFIRIPAGAALAASVFGATDSSWAVAAAIVGGTLAAGTHFAKAGTRAALNTSPEPVSNWAASFTEDGLVPLGLWLAFAHPYWFAAFLGIGLVVIVLILVFLWKFIRAFIRKARVSFSRTAQVPPPVSSS